MHDFFDDEQGDVFICGRKRHGLISDEEIPGLRIGLVRKHHTYIFLFFFFVGSVWLTKFTRYSGSQSLSGNYVSNLANGCFQFSSSQLVLDWWLEW